MKYSKIKQLLLAGTIAMEPASTVLAGDDDKASDLVLSQPVIRTVQQLTHPEVEAILPPEGQTARFIVKLKSSSQIQDISFADRGVSLTKELEELNLDQRVYRKLPLIYSMAAELSRAEIVSLLADDRVAYIERDPVRTILPLTETESREMQAETTPYGIQMVQALKVSDSAIANRTVCITDTGYTPDHEDLRPYDGVNISGMDNDGRGNDTGDWFYDGHGHGTHVAGTISALGSNGLGVVGVSPSNAVGLYIVKVFDDSGYWGYGSDLIAAVQQCIDAGAHVISMSLGGAYGSSSEREAFQSAASAGVLTVAAAGNAGSTAYSYPASYSSVVSVAAIDSNKSLASFSQRNSQVEMAAPGVSVLSTLPGNSYEAWSGTSMATPHVSGVAALVWSHFPGCSRTEIRHALNASAEDLGSSGRDDSYGYGLVQAKAAYDYLTSKTCTGNGDDDGGKGTGRIAGISADTGQWVYFTVDVPAGTSYLDVSTSANNGDADLYIRPGAQPTRSVYACRSLAYTSNEFCPIFNPTITTWHVGVYAYRSFADLTMSWYFE